MMTGHQQQDRGQAGRTHDVSSVIRHGRIIGGMAARRKPGHFSRMRHSRLTGLLFLCAVPSLAAAQARPSYRDPSRPVEERVSDLIGRMTVEEKFWQLFMIPGSLDDPTHDYSHGAFGLQVRGGDTTSARAHSARIDSIQHYFVERTRFGIPIIPFEEALHGLGAPNATSFPQAIALAATWDTSLMARVATAAARETRSRGIRDALSPVINIASDVRWGRVEETYGEDPVLSSQMARAFVAAFEHAGVIATPKHFIANVGEGGRDSYPVDLSRRQLEERFFPPFRASIVDAHARSVMSSYNSVNGIPSTQNRMLLTDVLRGEWGFTGFTISDAAATGGPTVLQHTEASTAMATKHALEAGLDVIFQSSWEQHRAYLDAFRRRLIADSVVDRAVAHVLRAKFELGLFEHPYANLDSAQYWNGRAEHRALAREAARASIVLLRNERGTLPLATTARRIAVIGADASEVRLGGYSGPGIAPVSILAGLRQRFGAAVQYAPGVPRVVTTYVAVPAAHLTAVDSGRSVRGLRAEYFDNITLAGVPRVARVDDHIDFHWTLGGPARGVTPDWLSARWSGKVTVPAAPKPVRIGVEGNDGYRLWIDGALVLDDWVKRSFGTRFATGTMKPGSTHDVRLEYFETSGNARVKLVWDAGVVDDREAKIADAVALAKRSNVAIVVAGIDEGEFRDRASLALPGHQEELIERVAATGTPTVVVLVGGSAITMSPWLERVGAVIDVWYPGEEGGRALADVLGGDYNPAGRLPITFPVSEGQLPLSYNHEPTGRGDDYLDLTGQPLFPFGFGLSYTSFEYSALAITPDSMAAVDAATLRFRVTNSGARAGDEVVQLYLHDVLATVGRPVIQLQGFQRIHLAAGEVRDVVFTIGREQLQLFDRDDRWVVEPGTFRVMVGSSSKDIRLRGTLTVR
ncbi:MAG: glycoside hydrolase family 3 C-terminal domain-containing protein [Gemmatimonadaceae bacterium]